MNLLSTYHFQELVCDDGIQTFRAREATGGQAIEIHLFKEDSAAVRGLFERVRGLPLSVRRELLEVGIDGTLPYIITEPLPAGTSARDYFGALSGGTAAPRQEPMKTEAPKIRGGVWKTGDPLPKPLFPGPSKSDEPKPEEAAGPGEFTRMFQAPQAATPPANPPEESDAKNVAPAPQPAANEGPGEFTRMFKAPPAPTAEPGEFTRMFQAPQERKEPEPDSTPTMEMPAFSPGKAPEPEPASPPPIDPDRTRIFQPPQAVPPARPEPRDAPSEFTRFFESPLQPQPLKEPRAGMDQFGSTPLAPTPSPDKPGEFTQMFGNPSKGVAPQQNASGFAPLGGGASATGAFASPVQPINPARSSAPKEPGEFTRMMAAGSISATPSLGQPASSAPATPAKSNMPLIVILAALALFAVLIILFFVLRQR